MAGNYEEVLNQHKTSRSKASEIENAIKQHIRINIDEDPEYYKKLSERLKDIIQRQGEKWDELVQLLLDFRNDIEKERKQGASEAGLTETEYAFYNILLAELKSEKTIDE